RVSRALRQSVRRRGARLHRRCHRAARNAASRDPRAAHAGEQSGHHTSKEARKYPAMKFAACLLLFAAALPAQDWEKLSPEMQERFTELLKIDSSNPPGNETKVAKVVQA